MIGSDEVTRPRTAEVAELVKHVLNGYCGILHT